MPKKLLKLTTSDLMAELRMRQRRVPPLERRRRVLLMRLREIENQIDQLNGSPQGNGRKRHRNAKPLAEALASVVSGSKPMGIAEAIEAVLASGYKTTADNFRTIVNQTLINDKRFKKVGRGLYLRK